MQAVDALPTSAETISYNFVTLSSGTHTWSNPSNITAADSVRSNLTEIGTGTTQSLIAYNFGFNLPSTAIIVGIEIEVRMQQSSAGGNILLCRLLKDRSLGSSSDYSVNRFQLANLTSSNTDQNVFAGSTTSSDWGGWTTAATGLTYTDINSANFGVALASNSSFSGYNPKVDWVKIRIQYTTNATSATSAGTGATSGGTVAWTNPGNITSSNNVYATQAVSTLASDNAYLQATNFGFAIPTTSTIDAIKVEIERKQDSVFAQDDTVQLLKAGVAVGSNAANAVVYPTADAYYTYNLGLWGTTWTPAEVNSSTFGVQLRCKSPTFTSNVSIDNIRITIIYSSAPPTPSSLGMMGVGTL